MSVGYGVNLLSLATVLDKENFYDAILDGVHLFITYAQVQNWAKLYRQMK